MSREDDGGYSDDEQGSHDSESDEGSEDYKKGGYHPINIGDVFHTRYRVVRKLGWGHFSTVWLAHDSRTDNYVALKVVKSSDHYTEAAEDEVEMLACAAKKDGTGNAPVIRLLDHFHHHGANGRHVCMVFEVLGCHLLRLIKQYNYRGLPVVAVKRIAKQVLEGLAFMHDTCHLIHTDLKPENVLLTITPEEIARMGSESPDLTHIRGVSKKGVKAADGTTKLTKNQKKRIKQKAKKQAAKAAADAAASAAASGAENGSAAGKAEVGTPVAADSVGGESTPPMSPTMMAITPTAEAAVAEDSSAADAEGEGDAESMNVTGSGKRQRRAPIVVDEGITVKIADLGNACWTHKHFTDDIQTRQYRAPEVIVGAKYGPLVDMWSMACMCFELMTGDFLFDPHGGEYYDRDEDHLARFIETLGPLHKFKDAKYWRDFFTSKGQLRNIRNLHSWPLHSVLVEKYGWAIKDAVAFAMFLKPMLESNPARRASAREMLEHPWLVIKESDYEAKPVRVPPPMPAGAEDESGRRRRGTHRDEVHDHEHEPAPSETKEQREAREAVRGLARDPVEDMSTGSLAAVPPVAHAPAGGQVVVPSTSESEVALEASTVQTAPVGQQPGEDVVVGMELS